MEGQYIDRVERDMTRMCGECCAAVSERISLLESRIFAIEGAGLTETQRVALDGLAVAAEALEQAELAVGVAEVESEITAELGEGESEGEPAAEVENLEEAEAAIDAGQTAIEEAAEAIVEAAAEGEPGEVAPTRIHFLHRPILRGRA